MVARSDGRRAAREELPALRVEAPERAAQSLEVFLALMDSVATLAARLDPAREVYLYGAGFYAALVSAYLAASGVAPAGIFDANPHKQGTLRLGRRVEAPETIRAARHGEAQLVVCVNPAVSAGIARRWGGAFHAAVALASR